MLQHTHYDKFTFDSQNVRKIVLVNFARRQLCSLWTEDMKSEVDVEVNFQPTIEVESAESDDDYADDTIEYFDEDDRYFDYDATEEGRISIGVDDHFISSPLFWFSFDLI
jgi:hypothetical protein